MALTNCIVCGKLFDSRDGKNLCLDCRSSEEKDFQKVRLYVRDNPRVPLSQVSDVTGVPITKIRDYIKKGLLESININVPEKRCEICKVEIRSGNYCTNCLRRMYKSSKKTSEKKKSESFVLNYRKKHK